MPPSASAERATKSRTDSASVTSAACACTVAQRAALPAAATSSLVPRADRHARALAHELLARSRSRGPSSRR